MTASDPIDRLVTAADSGRLRRDLFDILEGEPFSRIEEWAESLTEIAEQVSTAKDAIEAWADEDVKETKASLRDDAIEALEELVTTWNASPLDVSSLTDFDPGDDES